ncbi:transposase family protein [Streptomyces sp. NPDC001617]
MLDQLTRAEAAAPVADAVRLHHYLALVPDPRGRRGRLYPLVPLLSAAAASVLAGARSLTAIGEWLADAPRWALRALGFAPDPLTGRIPVPHPGTVRRLLARLDGDALDAAIGSFLTARNTPTVAGARRPIAVDGKTVRGSRTATFPAIALPAAMTHTGDVLAQRQVADKSNEIPAFAPLLDTLGLTELFAGHAAEGGSRPAPYPASCRPQAWASAASVLVLQAALDLEPDVPSGTVTVVPAFAHAYGPLPVSGLQVGGRPLRVTVGPDGTVDVMAPVGPAIVTPKTEQTSRA